jgi:uncharacterized protein YndB with AHSA1/START domain
VKAPERLVAIVSFTDEKGNITTHPASPNWPREVHSTVTFTEKNDKTTMRIEWKAYNASAIEAQTFEEGQASMQQGWGGSLDQLEAFFAGRVRLRLLLHKKAIKFSLADKRANAC